MNEKKFAEILKDFYFSIKKTKRSLSDLRLTNTEKLIVEGYLGLRKNLNQEVYDSVSNIAPSRLTFVEAHRLLLLGSALINLSRFKEAEKYIYESIEKLNILAEPCFLFETYYALFVVYDNLNNEKKMLFSIEEMRKTAISKRHEVNLLVCELCYQQQIENYKVAKNILKKIEPLKSHLSESDFTSHLVNEFMFYVQIEDLTQAKLVLNQYKKSRNYQLSENYNFMKKLLDHITEDIPLYIYDHQFEKVPLLLHQLKVVQALEEKNFEKASSHWEELKLISPSTYGEDYDYKAPTCLFSLALKKHLLTQEQPLQFIRPSGETKLDKLISLLSETNSPIPADLIFEIIWESPAETKDDLQKVAKLVSRAKKERSLPIEFRKGTYQLFSQNSIRKIS